MNTKKKNLIIALVSVGFGIVGWTLSFYWLGWKTSLVLLLVMTANNMDLKKQIR